VIVASAPRETNWRFVDERNDWHLLTRCRAYREPILPLGLRAERLSLVRAAECVR
jgi:hypothetical protein